jgi:hypothetical protein
MKSPTTAPRDLMKKQKPQKITEICIHLNVEICIHLSFVAVLQLLANVRPGWLHEHLRPPKQQNSTKRMTAVLVVRER